METSAESKVKQAVIHENKVAKYVVSVTYGRRPGRVDPERNVATSIRMSAYEMKPSDRARTNATLASAPNNWSTDRSKKIVEESLPLRLSTRPPVATGPMTLLDTIKGQIEGYLAGKSREEAMTWSPYRLRHIARRRYDRLTTDQKSELRRFYDEKRDNLPSSSP